MKLRQWGCLLLLVAVFYCGTVFIGFNFLGEYDGSL
jgi:hypothetical protein